MSLRPSKLLKISGFPLVGVAIFMLLGGHWVTLQAVAWSKMVVDYSRDAGSFSSGIKKTFSGKYPCAMCKEIAEAKQKEQQKPTIANAETKIFGIVALGYCVQRPAVRRCAYPPISDFLFLSRSDRPPTPVPIIA
jgi:hypothetical protein